MASTITETLRNQDNSLYTGYITFVPPQVVKEYSSNLFTSRPIVLSVTSGALSTTLVPGRYTVKMDGTPDFVIEVPEADDSYELHTIVDETGQEVVGGYTYLYASEQVLTDQQKRTVQ